MRLLSLYDEAWYEAVEFLTRDVDLDVWLEALGHKLEELLVINRTLWQALIGFKSRVELGQVFNVVVVGKVGPQARKHIPLANSFV